MKKMFLKVSQNSQENRLKKDSSAGDFLWILQNIQDHLFYRIAPVVASEAPKKFAIRRFRETLPIK